MLPANQRSFVPKSPVVVGIWRPVRPLPLPLPPLASPPFLNVSLCELKSPLASRPCLCDQRFVSPPVLFFFFISGSDSPPFGAPRPPRTCSILLTFSSISNDGVLGRVARVHSLISDFELGCCFCEVYVELGWGSSL
ncbi:hypothetical protein MARPO_0047s0033 [Marchantia polymorpha]|uniref:Uncharacterized protein n=1 Tax=Marchantia polymorpha TaxID=3197 RepID=A0A2R6WYX0_MARPO|nr:hypothetical protein MARPO_0047s0033 [Marchantia polymorpha]|eukprot:PTQ39050.1 hypothetical protein MARPO_0047s0033 [Marchantia polymorpha]